MKRVIPRALVVGLVCAVLFSSGTTSTLATAAGRQRDAGSDEAVLQADRALVAALAKADRAAVEKMLDAEFLWTNSAGEPADTGKTLASLPKPPLGDEAAAQVAEHTYAQLGEVQAASGKVHVLRIWGKRPDGWRLVAYHEVTQRDAPSTAPPGPTTNVCDNPCKGVPYAPKNQAEKDILESWGELETAVTNHQPDVWSQHFLDEFVLVSSGSTEPVPKSGRMAQLSKPGIGPAPPPLAANPAARFVHFGDSVVMMAQTNPYAGKPARVTRIWVKRDGLWRMAVSFQTTIQAAPANVPPA